MPTSWDETKVLNGLPGEYITIARRHGDEWFLGSMTSWVPRELELPLEFLGAGRYRAEVYADADDADRLPNPDFSPKLALQMSCRAELVFEFVSDRTGFPTSR